MNVVHVDLHCPYCGKDFSLDLEENASEDDLIEECPLCGHALDLRLVLSPEGKLVGAEVFRADGDGDD